MPINTQPIEFRLHGRRNGTFDPAARLSQAGRLPRVTQMMAMALSFQERLHAPDAPSYARMAREATITPERFSQVMNLVWLAPDIQREILELAPGAGRHPLTEQALRLIARRLLWAEQRREWRECKQSLALD